MLKVAGWVTLVVIACVYMLADAATRGWRPPSGRYAWFYPIGIGCALYFLFLSAAITLNFALARGVAIAAVGDEFVMYYLWSWKHITLQPGLRVTATEHEAQYPDFLKSPFFKTPQIVAQQITIGRPGRPDILFRTGLLRESSKVIADRMSAVARR